MNARSFGETGMLLKRALCTAAAVCLLANGSFAASPAQAKPPEQKPADDQKAGDQAAPVIAGKLLVTVGMSITIDSALNIQRVYIANDNLAEAVAITPREVL